jgi:hypothetical protein
MKKLPLFILLLVIFAYFGLNLISPTIKSNDEGTDKVTETFVQPKEESPTEMNNDSSPVLLEAVLSDVSGGNSTGKAFVSNEDDQYNLYVEFQNLPEPDGSDFYEGWVVRKSPLSVISTGVVKTNSEGVDVNQFTDIRDLTDHGTYVLTLEPDDGDPAPALHILEGKFQSL